MALAKLELICESCKTPYLLKTTKFNQSDIEEWEKQILSQDHICPNCLSKQKRQARALKEKELGLLIYVGLSAININNNGDLIGSRIMCVVISGSSDHKEALTSAGYENAKRSSDMYAESALNSVYQSIYGEYAPYVLLTKEYNPSDIDKALEELKALNATPIYIKAFKELQNYTAIHTSIYNGLAQKHLFPVLVKYNVTDGRTPLNIDKEAYSKHRDDIDKDILISLCKAPKTANTRQPAPVQRTERAFPSTLDMETITPPPKMPECYPKGLWNGKIYSNNTLYIDNKRTVLSDDEIRQILDYKKAMSEYAASKK